MAVQFFVKPLTGEVIGWTIILFLMSTPLSVPSTIYLIKGEKPFLRVLSWIVLLAVGLFLAGILLIGTT